MPIIATDQEDIQIDVCTNKTYSFIAQSILLMLKR